MFKCRSGKTFFIGDSTEEKNEKKEPYLFITSSCQLKSHRVKIFIYDEKKIMLY